VTPHLDFKVAVFFEIKYVNTVQDRVTITVEH